jgi:hypothetical protein
MKNQIGRIEKLESKVKDERLTSENELYKCYSPIREFLRKIDPEGCQVIDRLFELYNDNPELALQMTVRRLSTETLHQIVDYLSQKNSGSLKRIIIAR